MTNLKIGSITTSQGMKRTVEQFMWEGRTYNTITYQFPNQHLLHKKYGITTLRVADSPYGHSVRHIEGDVFNNNKFAFTTTSHDAITAKKQVADFLQLLQKAQNYEPNKYLENVIIPIAKHII